MKRAYGEKLQTFNTYHNAMMYFSAILGLCFTIMQMTCAERRLTDGKLVHEPKRYMVYLVRSQSSPQKYDNWICGGAIVSPLYIVTSAACIEDVRYMYAIAGYNKYVLSQNLDQVECTKKRKKKIVYTCVPKAYDLVYENVEKWAYIDIGVAKVESPYDFTDQTYAQDCTHVPNQIPINYDPKYQEPGTDAIILGMGHDAKWRDPTDATDYNQNQLNYAATRIENKGKCKEAYGNVPKMNEIIDKYMICTEGAGNINDQGEIINPVPPAANGCGENTLQQWVECDDIRPTVKIDYYRKNFDIKTNNTRRHGICQNDHGGPLVTWIGSREYLIGVASLFRVNHESKCEGPYMFTSTQCNGAFLDCVINGEKYARRSSRCDKSPKERGFRVAQKSISWRNHPDGPADSEKVRLRPQLPIRN